MKIDYGKIIKNAFKFSLNYKRWLPYMALMIIFYLSIFVVTFHDKISDISIASLTPASALFYFPITWVTVIVILFNLAIAYINGAIIHQSWKDDYKESWYAVLRKYPSILAYIIVFSVIALVLGLVPVIGIIAVVLLMLFLLFSLQEIVIKDKDFYNAMKGSADIVKSNFFDVIILLILVIIISVAFVILLAIVVVIAVFVFGLAYSALGTINILSNINLVYLSGLSIIGLVMVLILSIINVFYIKATTDFYLVVAGPEKAHKKKPG